MMAARETAELHNLLGNVDERAGNFVAAADEYQRAAHMAPTEEHLFDWGNNLLQLHAYEEAAQVFTAAIARHPQVGAAARRLGIAQYSRGQYEDAVKSFCQAADLAPTDPRPYQFLGEMYGVAPAHGRRDHEAAGAFRQGAPAKRAGAVPLCDEPLERPARRIADQPICGRLKRCSDKRSRSIASSRRASCELGILLSDQQRYTEAIQELQRATRLEPDLAQAHYRLAQAYQRTGQKALAAKELEIFERLTAPTSRDDEPG